MISFKRLLGAFLLGVVLSGNPFVVELFAAAQVLQPDSLVAQDSSSTDTTAVMGTSGANTNDDGISITEQASNIKEFISFTKIFVSLIIIALTVFLIRFVSWVLDKLSERITRYRLTFKTFVPIIRIVLWVFAGYIIVAAVFQPEQEAIWAFFASAGIAIGFASQDILKNIFGGFMILLDKPFQVGDKITAANYYGEVVRIGLRTTRIVTPDDSLVSIPNGELMHQSVSNTNAGALDCQVVVDLYLPGTVDIQLAKQIAYEAALTSKFVYLKKPVVVNVVDDFKYTFLTKLKVKAYVHDIRYEFSFASDVTEIAKTEFIRLNLIPSDYSVDRYGQES